MTVVDCVPSFETEPGREVWLTMVACTIFFKSICSGTYKHQDGERARTENMVKKGPVLTEIEKKTAASTAKQNPVEKRPTGKVVGIVKRNWRACVLSVYSSLQG